MVDLPAEAVQATAETLYRDYDSEFGADHLVWQDFAEQARRLLEGALPALATQVRRQAALQLRAITVDDGQLKPPTRLFIDRHPRLRQGSSMVAVLLAAADEIENPPAHQTGEADD